MGPNLELPRTQVKPTLIALIQNPAPPLSQILTVHIFLALLLLIMITASISVLVK